MKKLFILSALVLGITGTRAMAQDFSFDSTSVYVSTPGLDLANPATTLDDAVTVYNHVHNETSGTLSGLKWQIIQTMDSTTTTYKKWHIHTFCDNIICYPSNQLTSNSTWPLNFLEFSFADIAYRAKSDFKMQVVVPTTAANGTVGIAKVRAWTANQADTAIYIVTKVSGSGLNVVKANDNRVLVFPNPALQNEVTVFVNKDLKATQTKVYNMIGVEVAVAKVDGELAHINTATFASGTYMVQVLAADGTLVATRKLVKN